MKTRDWKLQLWAVLAVAWVLEATYVQAQGVDPGPEAGSQITLSSPPSGTTLVGPLSLPLIAEVAGVDSGDVAVEFLNGDQSLGRADTPFGVLPGDDPGAGLGPSGVYSWTWEAIPVGEHVVTAVLWLDGVIVARSEPSAFELVLLDETTEVSVRVSDPVAAEGSQGGVDSGEFVVERTGRTETALEVFFEWDGVAEQGVDFQAVSGSVTIPEGQSSAIVSVQAIDDNLVEGAEEVLFRVLPPVCIDIFPPPADCYLVGRDHEGVVMIRDNDTATENEPPDVVMVKPLNGQTVREGASLILEAHAWDLDGRVSKIEFFDGNRLLGTVDVKPDQTEGPGMDPETGLPLPPQRTMASWTWENVPVGRYSLNAKATDDDGDTAVSPAIAVGVVGGGTPPVVTIEAVDANAAEEGAGTIGRPSRRNTGRFVVKRTGNLGRALQVGLEINGTATMGRDYLRLNQRLTLPANVASATVEVVPVDDREVEGTETVIVSIRSSDCRDQLTVSRSCYVVGREGRARVEISDNDRSPRNLPPTVSILRPRDGSEFNDSQSINIFAQASDRDGRVVAVEFFANEESLGTIRSRGNGRQTNQLFHLRVKALAAGRYNLVAVATDDDGVSAKSEPVQISVGHNLIRAVVNVVALDSVAAELTPRGDVDDRNSLRPRALSNHATFVITRSGRTDVALSVAYQLSGTAENGVDYRELSGEVKFEAGETRSVLTIAPVDDDLVEGQETVVLDLQVRPCAAIFPPPADCYTLGSRKSARVVIRDNDRDVNQRPRIALTEPANGAEFVAPATVQLQAQSKDEDGFVRVVHFLANGRRLGSVDAARPDANDGVQEFDFKWSDVGPGRYRLEAIAVDDDGAEARSEVKTIVVSESVVRSSIVSVEAVDATARETVERRNVPNDVGRFRFSRRGNLDVPLRVTYRIGGTAINGRDYRRVDRGFTFEAGESAVDLIIEPVDDNRVEGTESVVVSLVAPSCVGVFPPPPECYSLGEDRSASVRLFDNDREENLLPKVAIVSPRNRSVFHVPATVNVRVEAVDRDGWIGQVILMANGREVADQSINFIREPDPGEVQHFGLSWENVPEGQYELTAIVIDDQGGRSRSRSVDVTIAGERDLPVVTVFARDALALEPTDQHRANEASLRVRRTGKTDEDLVVYYTVSGTAQNGQDYEKLSGEITIPAKKRWATLKVIPLADGELERSETVLVRLTDEPSAGRDVKFRVGRPAQAGVVINNRNQSVAGSQRLSDGTVHVCIPAPNGKTFRIEAGTSLDNWEVVGTNTVTDDAVHIVDTETAGTTFRFFRIVPDIDDEAEEDED